MIDSESNPKGLGLRHFCSRHEEYVHDIAYDFYGQQLATGSSDQKIKIWRQQTQSDENSNTNTWKCIAELQSHSGSILKVAWAHPEFGQVLASCSIDCIVNIYQEIVDVETGHQRWNAVAQLVDSHNSVQDVQFAPRHLGMRLATCSLDGLIRIYTATDLMDLSLWSLTGEFEADKKNCYSISWNTSAFESPMLLVGSQSGARVWQFNEDKKRRWVPILDLPGHQDIVHDVSWAPNLGRSYHLLATASKDGFLRIWKVSSHSQIQQQLQEGEDEQKQQRYTAECVAKFDSHRAEVWRVEWNITGTILASSGDDGSIHLWASDLNGQWSCVLVVPWRETMPGSLHVHES